MVMPPLRQTSMHSLIKACTTLLEERSEAASPKVQPRTALIPENAALIRSLLQRVPRKFSSTSTGPIFSRRALTSAKCLLTFSETAPNEKVRLSGELVNSQTPGPSIVAPQATVQPSTRDGPTISEISSSGNPFWRVTITPSSARKPLSIFTTSALCNCLVIRNMTSYSPVISSSVRTVTG